MAKCKLLALLLCEGASVAPEPDSRVTLHHLFDRIVLRRTPEKTDVTFIWAYYKVVVDAPCTVDSPCTVALRIVNPQGEEVPGTRRHSIVQDGPIQGVWALDTGLFKELGPYRLELREESEGSEPHTLASTRLVVALEGK